MSPIRPLSAALFSCLLFACAAPDAVALESGSQALTVADANGAILKPVTPITIDPGLVVNPGIIKVQPKANNKACSNTAIWTSPSSTLGCPEVGKMSGGSWKPRNVFGREAPADLARICAYDWTPDSNTSEAPPDIDKLGSALNQYHMQPPELDCPVVSGLGAPADPVLDGELWRAMRDNAYKQADRAPFVGKSRTHVQVAVLDTAGLPFEEASLEDRYGHGRLVGQLIQALTCNDGEKKNSCLTEIHNYLSMPWVDSSTRDDTLGGYMGHREDLVQAIQKALSDYLTALSRSALAPRLVLVIAAGWDPIHGGDGKSPEELSPASFQVYAALARAACLGVPAVAASGNVHGSSDNGPLLPAGWETLATPTAKQCAKLVGFSGDKIVAQRGLATSADGQSPLVYAASAVDEHDHLLATARKHAEPRLVAYGLSMVTDDTRGTSDHTPILTGTSFGAALAGAAIAAAWAFQPRVPPQKIVDLVHDTGVATGDTAELCFSGMCDEVTRISVCSTLQKSMCSAGLCSSAPACNTVASGAGTSLDAALFDRSFDPKITGTPALDPMSAPIQGVYEDPWLFPQPDHAGCSGRCVVQALANQAVIELSNPAQTETTDLVIVAGGSATRIAPPYSPSMRISVPSVAPNTRAVMVRTVNTSSGPAIAQEDIDVVN